jgi:putative transcriptional regulator
MTLTELANRIGMMLANFSILKIGKARAIRFSTLNAICRALSCQPGDILRFEPDADGWTSFWLNLPCDFELCESSQPFIVLKRVR